MEDRDTWKREALEQLRKTASAEPDIEGSRFHYFYVCGNCRSVINYRDSFCWNCGTPVDWDGGQHDT